MAGQSGAIRAGRAFVELFADNNLLVRGLNDAKNQVMKFGDFFKRTGAAMAGVGASLFAPLAGLFTMAAERGRDMLSLSQQFGVTTESISGLAAGFESAGVSFGEFGATLSSLREKLVNHNELFNELRLNSWDLAKLPIDKALERTADAISKMKDPFQQSQIAVEMFGETVGTKLLEYLKQGAEGIKRLKAAGSPFAIDTATATRGKEIMDGMTAIWQQFQYSILDIGAALFPTTAAIKSTVNWVKQAGLSIRGWVADNKHLIVSTAAIAAGLVAAGTAFAVFGVVATGVMSAVSIATSVFGGIAGLITSLPALLTVAGVATVAYFAMTSETGKQAVSGLNDTFVSLKDTAVSAFDGIAAAIKTGDFVTAFKIAITAMMLEWEKFRLKLNESTFKAITGESLGRTTGGALGGLALMGNDLDAFLKKHTIGFDENEVERERQRKEKEIMLRDSETARDAELGKEKPDTTEVDRLTKLLEELKATAKGGGGELLKTESLLPIADLQQVVSAGSQLPALFEKVKGTFSTPAAAQQLGIGDNIAKRQLQFNEQTAKNTEATRKAVAELGTAWRFR